MDCQREDAAALQASLGGAAAGRQAAATAAATARGAHHPACCRSLPPPPCSRTARRLFWYLLACAIGVVLVRWMQSIEGIGMMWVFLSAVRSEAALKWLRAVVAVACGSRPAVLIG